MSQEPVVAHVVNRYFPVSANWLYNIADHIEGWHSLILARTTENLSTINSDATIFSRSRDLPLPVRLADGALRHAFGGYPSFYSIARWYDARLIHAHMGPMGYESLATAERLDLPLVTSFYGKDASQLTVGESAWQDRYRELFEKGELFLAEGPNMAAQLQDLGCPVEKIEVHRIGVDLDRYPFRPRHRDDGEPLRVLMVGRFVEKKGLVDGVQAFTKFVEKGGKGVLNIVGDSNGSEVSEQIKEEIIQTIRNRDLTDQVNLHGFLAPEELRGHYHDNHVLLVPSRTASTGDNEGGAPVAIIEAQATGLPVVGTDHCDIPNIVKSGETGLIVGERDVVGMSEALATIYEGNKSIVDIGKKSKKFVVNNHSREIQMMKMKKRYSKLK